MRRTGIKTALSTRAARGRGRGAGRGAAERAGPRMPRGARDAAEAKEGGAEAHV